MSDPSQWQGNGPLAPRLTSLQPISPIPDMVFHSFAKKYQPPDMAEGIDSIETHPFVPLFSDRNDSGLSPDQQEKEWLLHYY